MSCRRSAIVIWTVATLVTMPASAVDRYVAWLADGTRLTTHTLTAWPVPGTPYRFENQDLLGTSNPARFVRDRQASPALKPPFVVLANGDVLGGLPVQLEPDGGRASQTPRVRVQLEPPIVPVAGTSISVRTDRVRRIVASAEPDMAPPPGTVVLADGKRLIARSIRWREYGLAILTSDGVAEATFSDLADVVFPNVDLTAAVLDDNLWAGGASGAAIARFQTTSGSLVTAARVSREQEQSRRRGRVTQSTYYYVQPAWADQPLALPEQEIACCGYRAADEAPLVMFPSQSLASRRLTGSSGSLSESEVAEGSWLATRDRESDLGIAAHAYREIAFDLPVAAKSLELAIGLAQSVGERGCVRCKIIAADSNQRRVLWDSGVIQGKDGTKSTGALDVTGVKRLLLVTEFAHEERPPDADPLDIRDEVVWLSPLVKLDLSAAGPNTRLLAVLPGVAEWNLAGDDWRRIQLANRWNIPASGWDTVVTLPKDVGLKLERTLRVTRASDVVELLTVCPVDLEEHDFALRVNGEAVPWHNNADRNQLRQWTLRYSRTRARDGDEESNLTDRLAYWWDLAQWRGQDVTLELTLSGQRERNEIAWRSLSVRSAIGNLPEGGEPVVPDLLLALADQSPSGATAARGSGQPIRLLGQEYKNGWSLKRGGRITFRLKPDYQKFVAVVGCTIQVAGPVQVLIDERVAWERASISSLSPAEQIEIAIPPGARTLTLQSGAEGLYYGSAAFAEAGFLVGQAASLP
jgi:hypothetical protein